MMRRVLLSGSLLLACSVRSPDEGVLDEGGSGSDTQSEDTLGSETGSETASEDTLESEDTGPPECDPFECMQTCDQNFFDECGHSMVGSCSDMNGCTCVPEPNDCQPCLPENCGTYEMCADDYTIGGECMTACAYEFHFLWDPEIGCVLPLPPELADRRSYIFGLWFLDIPDTQVLEGGESCDDPVVDWVLDPIQLSVSLCPAACEAFEAIGELDTGWQAPCE
jgi:hypothetical protein